MKKKTRQDLIKEFDYEPKPITRLEVVTLIFIMVAFSFIASIFAQL